MNFRRSRRHQLAQSIVVRPADVSCRACATSFGGAIARAGAVAGSIDPVAPPAADIHILSGHPFENTVCCHGDRSSGTKSRHSAQP